MGEERGSAPTFLIIRCGAVHPTRLHFICQALHFHQETHSRCSFPCRCRLRIAARDRTCRRQSHLRRKGVKGCVRQYPALLQSPRRGETANGLRIATPLTYEEKLEQKVVVRLHRGGL